MVLPQTEGRLWNYCFCLCAVLLFGMRTSAGNRRRNITILRWKLAYPDLDIRRAN